MRPQHEVETARALLANAEMALHRAGGLNGEMKSWLCACRAALSWVLMYPQGGRKVDELLRMVKLETAVRQTGGVAHIIGVAPGSKLLDAMRNPEEEKT